MFQIALSVNQADLEPGYNHLNHAAALSFLEKGRLRFLESIGFPNEEFHTQGLFLVVTTLQVRYLREIFAGEITVTVDSAETDEKDLILTQRALNQKNKECITAVITFRFVDGAKKRSVGIPEDFLAAAVKALR